MAQNIVIYQDEGVGEFGLTCLREFFRDDSVRLADADTVREGTVLENADIFVMPGGADLPYCRKLNGKGNANIRNFVENGGTYLGICAGAYYACKALEFHKGRADEISGHRELALADAVAYGSLPEIAPYYDMTLKSAGLVKLNISGKSARFFYHGGPAFRLENNETNVLACYEGFGKNPPAIIKTRVGSGHAVLLGVHAEMTSQNMGGYPAKGNEKEILKHIIARMSQDSTDTHGILRDLLRV